MAVVGVDGCKVGWIAVRLEEDGDWDVGVFPDVGALWHEWRDAGAIFIDIPIGLPDKRRPVRRCDTEARRLLGRPRSSSVFPPPSRAALSRISHDAASRINVAEVGTKLNQQTWNILSKIREVDAFLASENEAKRKVREIHPEVCFRAFNAGQAIVQSKKTPEGKRARLDLLRKLDNRTDPIRDQAMKMFLRREVAEDDIHDALVTAITATYNPDDLISIPSTPEFDTQGLPMEMVYARTR